MEKDKWPQNPQNEARTHFQAAICALDAQKQAVLNDIRMRVLNNPVIADKIFYLPQDLADKIKEYQIPQSFIDYSILEETPDAEIKKSYLRMRHQSDPNSPYFSELFMLANSQNIVPANFLGNSKI